MMNMYILTYVCTHECSYLRAYDFCIVALGNALEKCVSMCKCMCHSKKTPIAI